MRVAVLTLTRDRLDYTKHCFGSLREYAGCEYDHYVLDQASGDGTLDWLTAGDFARVVTQGRNVGISRGMNVLLDAAGDGYDVYVTFDNDCEVTMPGTLATAARVAHEGGWIVSPRVEGLLSPPTPGPPVDVAGEPVGPYAAVGGIFRTMPGSFAREFRFNEQNPTWGGDEVDAGITAATRGFGMGYLMNWSVNHYRTTAVQNAENPEYWERKKREMGIA